MKKTFSLLTALVLGCGLAFGQEVPFIKHISLGIGLLGTDGNSIVVAAPVNDYVQVRAGFTTNVGTFAIGNAVAKRFPEVGGITPFQKTMDVNINQSGIKIDKLDLAATIHSNNLELLCDLFPGRNTGFHFTVGAYFNLAPKGLVRVNATPRRDDGQSVFPDAPNKSEIYNITADANGTFHANLQYGCKVIRPYVGIGFGRPVSVKHRVGVNFDMGFAYLGGAKLVSYNYFKDPAKPVTVNIDEAYLDTIAKDNPDAKDQIDNIKGYMAKANEFPYFFATKFYPILKLSIFVRLF